MIPVHTIESKNKQEVSNKHTITCGQCGKYLGDIIESNEPDRARTYQCYCTCGNECFLIRTTNKTAILTHEHHAILDMRETPDGIMNVKIGKFA